VTGPGARDDESSSQAFLREYRLLQATAFARVFSCPEQRRCSDRYFTVLACPSELQHSRLGLAISKKQLRRAVDRNRVKRLVRDHFRRFVRPSDSSAFDYVVMARSAVRQTDGQALREALARLFDAVRK
jgi:ribonuclease P protein component